MAVIGESMASREFHASDNLEIKGWVGRESSLCICSKKTGSRERAGVVGAREQCCK